MRVLGLVVLLVLGLLAAPASAQRTGAMNEAATFVAFTSSDSNLVAGDTNNTADVFVRDVVAGLTTRVSVASNGLQGWGDSNLGVDIDDSGRYVVFGTTSALAPNDTNTCISRLPGHFGEVLPCPDVYLHDRVTGETTWISKPPSGLSNEASELPSISADGAWIVFASAASNLVPGDTNGKADLFLVERSTGAITLISTAPGGAPANGDSGVASITADGRYVAFISGATNLTSDAGPPPCSTNDTCQPGFLYDRVAHAISRIPMPVFADVSRPRDVWVNGLDISPDGIRIGMSIDTFVIGLEAPIGAVYDRVHDRFVHVGRGSDEGVISRDGHFATGSYLIENFTAGGASVVDLRTGVTYGPGTNVTPLDIALAGRRFLVSGSRGLLPPPPVGVTALDSRTLLLDLDPDGDGLPSAWETYFGLDATSGADRLGDPDGDGITTADEYLDGTHPHGLFKYYFAEGAANGFFSTRVSILDPGAPVTLADSPRVVIRLLGENALQLSAPHAVYYGRTDTDYAIKPPPATNDYYGLIPAKPVPDASFSTVVESAVPLVVERSMTWGTGGYGSHAERAVSGPNTTWFLAEGATHGGFLLYYLLGNPGSQPADVTITYLRPAPLTPIVRTYAVAARSRRTIWVNGENPVLAATDVSARVSSTRPMVVERSMYRDTQADMLGVGTVGAGVAAAPRWFLAEGATGTFFDLFYLIANPSTNATRVRVTYLLDQGAPLVEEYDLAPQSRRTLSVAYEDPRLANVTLSAIVESLDATGIVVERAMYWPTGGPWQDGHVSAGATVTARRWATSGGRLRDADGTETFLLIANTSAAAGTATVTAIVNSATYTRTVALPANSRVTVRMRDMIPADATAVDFGVRVESDGPQLVVERATYSDANGVVWAAGEALLATPLP